MVGEYLNMVHDGVREKHGDDIQSFKHAVTRAVLLDINL